MNRKNSQTGNYICFASLIVSGNFFEYVSGLKTTITAAMTADAPNNRAGSDPYWEP